MNTGPGIPLRRLVLLTLAVMAVHLWLLRGMPAKIVVSQRIAAPAFIARGVVLPPPAMKPVTPAARLSDPPPAGAALPRATKAATRPSSAKLARPAAPSGLERLVARLPLQSAAPLASDSRPVAAEPVSPAVRFAIAPPMSLHFTVTGTARSQSWQGKSELSWHHDGAGYEARLEVNAPLQPARVQQSTGSIGAEGLAPLRFSDKRRGEEATHFQHEQGRVIFSSNRPDAPLQAGAQDRLSVLLQLGAMIAANPSRFPVGTTVALQTASTREADAWVFTVEAEEALDLPGGNVPALRLSRPPRHAYDQRIELWLAPAMAYVPVRLRLTQPNGDSVDHQWSSTDRR